MSESNNKIQENNNLQNEYRDLLTNGLSNDFLSQNINIAE